MTRSTHSLVVIAALLSVEAAGSLFCLGACGGNQVAPASPSPSLAGAAPAGAGAAKGTVKEAGDAKVGDTAKCPVSGEEFTVEASSPSAEHGGKTYFFCCSGCKKKFEANPAKYTTKP